MAAIGPIFGKCNSIINQHTITPLEHMASLAESAGQKPLRELQETLSSNPPLQEHSSTKKEMTLSKKEMSTIKDALENFEKSPVTSLPSFNLFADDELDSNTEQDEGRIEKADADLEQDEGRIEKADADLEQDEGRIEKADADLEQDEGNKTVITGLNQKAFVQIEADEVATTTKEKEVIVAKTLFYDEGKLCSALNAPTDKLAKAAETKKLIEIIDGHRVRVHKESGWQIGDKISFLDEHGKLQEFTVDQFFTAAQWKSLENTISWYISSQPQASKTATNEKQSIEQTYLHSKTNTRGNNIEDKKSLAEKRNSITQSVVASVTQDTKSKETQLFERGIKLIEMAVQLRLMIQAKELKSEIVINWHQHLELLSKFHLWILIKNEHHKGIA